MNHLLSVGVLLVSFLLAKKLPKNKTKSIQIDFTKEELNEVLNHKN